MPDERTTSAKRPYTNDRVQGEARLDYERGAAELKRFLDLALSEMGLAIENRRKNKGFVSQVTQGKAPCFEVFAPKAAGGSNNSNCVTPLESRGTQVLGLKGMTHEAGLS